MFTINDVFLPLIAIVLIVIAWRFISGEKNFNSFWVRLWTRAVDGKIVLAAIFGVTTLVISVYFAKDAFDDYRTEQRRAEYKEKSKLLQDEMRKRGVPSTFHPLGFGTQAEREAADRKSRILMSQCIREGNDIIVELNSDENTPELEAIHDYGLVSETCRFWTNNPAPTRKSARDAAATSRSPEFSPELEAIIRNVLAENGAITEDMHARFWAELNKGSPEEALLVANSLRKNLSAAQEYQRESWKSARISLENSAVIRTDRLLELDKMLLDEFKKTLPWPEDSRDYAAAIAAYQDRRIVSSENGDRLLKAAATHTPLITVTGQELPIDDQSISRVLANLDASFARLNRLLDPQWR